MLGTWNLAFTLLPSLRDISKNWYRDLKKLTVHFIISGYLHISVLRGFQGRSQAILAEEVKVL